MLVAREQVEALLLGDGCIRDSRGLARALTDDFEGAISDFEFYVQWQTEQGESRARCPTPGLDRGA